jgi:hypothetical protein
VSAIAGCLKVNILYNEAGSYFYVLFVLFLCHVLFNNRKCVHDDYMYMYMMGLCVPTELPT